MTALQALGSRIHELEELRAARRFDELADQGAAWAGEPGLSPLERGMALLMAGRAESVLHHLARAEERLTQAAEAFNEADAAELACHAELQLARTLLISGSLRQVEHLAQQRLAEARQHAWPAQVAYAQVLLGMVLIREHRYREALPLLREAQGNTSTPDLAAADREYAHDAANALAWALAGSGEVVAGMALAEAELARIEAAGASPTEIVAQLNALIFAAWCAGDFARMRPLQQRMLEVEQPLKRPMQLMTLYYNMAIAETQLGGFHSAKRHLHRSWDIARRTGDVRLLPPLLMLLSLLALHENLPELAREYAELSRTNMREFGTDESALVTWYLALAHLGAADLVLAKKEWGSKEPLEPSIENWLELAWMRRALGHIASPGFAPAPPCPAEVKTLAGEWEAELGRLLDGYPSTARPGQDRQA